MVGGGLVVELEALSGVTVLYVELPAMVTALDVAVGPEVLVEPGETISEVVVVVVAVIVAKLLEVVPEVEVKDSVGVVPEVVTVTGLVDTDGGDTGVLAVGSGEDGPEVVVLMVVVGDPVGGLPVLVVAVSWLDVSVTIVVLWGVDLEGVGAKVVVLVVDPVSVIPEVVTVTGLVDTDGVDR